MSRPLTKQQQVCYDFIRDCIVSRGYGPTVREIGEYMNIKSPNGVMCHLKALEKKSMIRRAANRSRAIELTEPISQAVGAQVRIGGSIQNSACLLAPSSNDQFDLAMLGSTGDRIALRVVDESLLDAQIRAGDFLILQKQAIANHGDLALVRTGDSETCLRYWMLEGPRIRLQPVSRVLPPMLVDHAEVLGVVTAVVRDLNPAMQI